MNIRPRISFILLIFSAIPIFLHAQPFDFEKRMTKFDEYIQVLLDHKKIAGLSVALEYEDFRWSKGYGHADIENQVPATALSSYRMASITKPMTATGILVLVDEGKIHLDAEVQKYVPYLPNKKWPVTIRHLLGHIAGISHYKNYDAECNTTRQMSTKEAIEIFAAWDLLFEPGSKYQYTTYGFNLLGAVIEGVSGQSYEEFMRERVWLPLAMENTQIDHLFRLIANRVAGYRFENNEIVNVRPVNTSLKFAGGGTRSTVLDLLNFAQGIQEGKLFSPALRELMWTCLETSDSMSTGYGLGWSVFDFNGRFTVGHGGGQEGTRTHLMHLPEHDITIAVASNFEETNPYEIAVRLAADLLDEPARYPYLYTGNWRDFYHQQVLRECFHSGMAYYDRYRAQTNQKLNAPGQALEYVNNMALNNFKDLSPDSVQKVINRGKHPLSGWRYRTAGAYMAEQIMNVFGSDRLQKLHGLGALAFFQTFAEAQGSGQNNAQLNLQLIRRINEWRLIEIQTHAGELQENISGLSYLEDAENLASQLKSAFSGLAVYPDFSSELSQVVDDALKANDLQKAGDFAQIAFDYYPQNETTITQKGIVEIINQHPERGKALLKKALQINPQGSAKQSNLNALAYRFAGWGQVASGLDILKVAIELNPEIANLYDSIGELYLMQGDTIQSIRCYEQALKIDPKFENAERMLKEIRGEK